MHEEQIKLTPQLAPTLIAIETFKMIFIDFQIEDKAIGPRCF